MTTLSELLASSSPDMSAITQHLDALDHDARLAQTRALGRAHQAKLFDIAQGVRSMGLDDLVPPSAHPMRGVWHHGRNTLPAFKYFAKVFCRPDEGPVDSERWGYNAGSSFVGTVVGPGYFVARIDKPGEVLVDYLLLPPRKADGWPEIIPNSARLSRFVYYRTQDILRGVSTHVSIGRATRDGKNMDAWFILCRQD